MKTKLIYFSIGTASTLLSSTLMSAPILNYSTYLGGPQIDIGHGIAVDAGGNIYVVGAAGANFPVVNAFQSANASAEGDAFLTKFRPNGSVAFATYIGRS